MIYENEVIKILKAHTGLECYLDYVPDKVYLPALSVTNLGEFQLAGRNLSGKSYGKGGEYRITIVTNTLADLNNISSRVFELDDLEFQLSPSTRDSSDLQDVHRLHFNLTYIHNKT